MANQGNGSDWVDPNSVGTPWFDPQATDYHMKQWTEPKESTKAFSEFFSNDTILNGKNLVFNTTNARQNFSNNNNYFLNNLIILCF